MNRHEIETLLLQDRDGALTPEQRAILEAGLVAHPDLSEMRTQLASAFAVLKSETMQVAVPGVDDEWRTLRTRLHQEARPAPKAALPRLVWLGSTLAAAAAVAFIFFNEPSGGSPTPGEAARADYVETGDADASTLVYVDKDSGWLVVWASNAEAPASG